MLLSKEFRAYSLKYIAILTTLLSLIILTSVRLFTTKSPVPSLFHVPWDAPDLVSELPAEKQAAYIRFKNTKVIERKRDGRLRFCRPCNSFKPDRTRHCRECGTCILGFDHHCHYFDVCIGFHNRKFLVLLVLYSFLAMLTVCFLTTTQPFSWNRGMRFMDYDIKKQDSWVKGMYFTLFRFDSQVMMLSSVTLLVTSVLGAAFIIQIVVVLRNYTAAEFWGRRHYYSRRAKVYFNPYALGYWENFKQVFGGFSQLPFWLLPVKVPPAARGRVNAMPRTQARMAYGDDSKGGKGSTSGNVTWKEGVWGVEFPTVMGGDLLHAVQHAGISQLKKNPFHVATVDRPDDPAANLRAMEADIAVQRARERRAKNREARRVKERADQVLAEA